MQGGNKKNGKCVSGSMASVIVRLMRTGIRRGVNSVYYTGDCLRNGDHARCGMDGQNVSVESPLQDGDSAPVAFTSYQVG